MTTLLSGGDPRARRFISLLAGAGLILAAVGVAWYFGRRPSVAPAAGGHQHGAAPAGDSARPVQLSDEAQHRIGVTFAPVVRAPLERQVRIVAQVTYDETRIRTISPRVEGWVERLFVDYTGRGVRAGEPLLRLYSPMVVTAAEELLLARRLLGELGEGAGESRANAERLVASARNRLLSWEVPADEIAALEERGIAPRTITLRAPAGGVVLEKRVFEGQRVMEGDLLYRLADLSTVWLEGEVFEQDLAAARVGQVVRAEFQALPGESRAGRISYVAPTLNQETRTGLVRVALANPGLRLRPGMFATLQFAFRTSPAVLSIPRSAVLSTGERNLVFVRRADGRFTPTDVVLGARTEERVEIRNGLRLGDTVVASATFLVDAESNLGSLFGGMGDMPGMDMTAPGEPPREEPLPAAPAGGPEGRDMNGMPGMETPAPAPPAPAGSGHQGHTGQGG